MNLNGEHNDPTIMRAKLSWDLFNQIGVVSSRANHVKLFINNEYYGLYLNVEHIDNEFLDKNYTFNNGNLFKCLYPADLTYLGDSPSDYKRTNSDYRIYDLTTNEEADDYTDLAEFIIFLNRTSDVTFEALIRDYIDVDKVLKVMAVDMITGMWDDYMFNNNNYYLYHNPETSQFELIPYDYDNTFGIDWFNIDWGNRDVDQWGSNDARPLTDRLFAIPKYRNRLHYYLRSFVQLYFNPEVLNPSIDRLKTMVQSAAEEDTYRTLDYGYTINDFNNSFTTSLGAHVKYGLKPYIETRSASILEQTDQANIVPIIKEATSQITYGTQGATLVVSASVVDDDTPTVSASITGAIASTFLLKDDGNSPDELANDGMFTGSIKLGTASGDFSLSVSATDAQSQTERYPFNPNDMLAVKVANTSTNLVINELMASNESTISDEYGGFADWVELYNPTTATVSLSGYYLTDDLSEPDKWAFPDTTIPPNGFLLIWVDDDDEDQGPMHASFKLSKDGEDMGLYLEEDGAFNAIDAFSFGPQTTDISFGRELDGSSTFIEFTDPTPGASNNTSTAFENEVEVANSIQLFQNYPNPFNPNTVISFELVESGYTQLQVFDLSGRWIQTLVDGNRSAGLHSVNFDGSGLSSGTYFYVLKTKSTSLTRKLVLIK